MKAFVRIVVGLLSLAIIAAIVVPGFYWNRPSPIYAHRTSCISNLKQASLALLLYQGDENDRYPLRDEWIDATLPYSKNINMYRCPGLAPEAWGYAFNGALSAAKTPKIPDKAPLLYDSVNPIKNASDLVSSLPAAPRHKLNVMSYADGHAKALPAVVK